MNASIVSYLNDELLEINNVIWIKIYLIISYLYIYLSSKHEFNHISKPLNRKRSHWFKGGQRKIQPKKYESFTFVRNVT